MRRSIVPWLAVLLLAAAGCTEVDDTVVIEVGTLRPSMANPQLGTQIVSIDPDNYRIQHVIWRVDPSMNMDATDNLHLDLGGVGINLTCVDPDDACSAECSFSDSAVTSPRAAGRCASGVVVDAIPQDQPGTTAVLEVRFSAIELYRLRPFAYELATVDDWDGDGVADESDNCPLIDNPDQVDTGMRGFGDACAVFDSFVGLTLLDSDRDGISDLRDNCPDTPNPDQADAGKPLGALAVPDGIGDACTSREQLATLEAVAFQKVLPSLNPVLLGNAWLTLDYADAFDCDWDAGTCTLDTVAVTFCRDLQGGVGCF